MTRRASIPPFRSSLRNLAAAALCALLLFGLGLVLEVLLIGSLAHGIDVWVTRGVSVCLGGLLAGWLTAVVADRAQRSYALAAGVMLMALHLGKAVSVGRVGIDITLEIFVPACAVLGGRWERLQRTWRKKRHHRLKTRRQSWSYQLRDGRAVEVHSPPRSLMVSIALMLLALPFALLCLVLFPIAVFFAIASGEREAISIPRIFGSLSFFFWNQSQKFFSYGKNVLADPDCTIVLYLRSFQVDNQTPEQQIANAFSKVGKVVAIGHPGEALPKLGAFRIYVRGRDWQDVVADLMGRAKGVILQAGQTEGLRWELEKVLRHVSPHQLALFLPFVAKAKASRQDQYAQFREWIGPEWRSRLPETIELSFLLAFDAEGRPFWVDKMAAGQLHDHPLAPALERLSKRELTRIPTRVTSRQILVGQCVMVALLGMVLVSAMIGLFSVMFRR